MELVICEKRKAVLDASGHILVTGGPGSGKTTVAILKALRQIEAGLKDAQSVLFLSFSRAAVARIIEATKKELLPSHRSALSIHTFHSFFWEILRTHGYLLGAPKHLTLLAPQDEKVLSNGIEPNEQDPAWQAWKVERERLFYEEGRTAFDLFAPMTSNLLSRSERIRRLIADHYPLIVVDEAQDTGPAQWACLRELARHSQLLCLADLEQQIFDYLPGIGPERVQEIKTDLHPLSIDLGSENNRSPDCEIVLFGSDVLMGVAKDRTYRGVSQLVFNARAAHRDQSIRRSVGIVAKAIIKEKGERAESIAILASTGRGVAIISRALREGPRPILHKVLFDETTVLLSSRFLAFLMEPKKTSNTTNDLSQALDLLSSIFRAKGGGTALRRSEQIRIWANQTRAGEVPTRAGLYKQVASLIVILQSIQFTGNPAKDWLFLRSLLRNTGVRELTDVDHDLQSLMLFNRGKRIASGFESEWNEHGCYLRARQTLDVALAQDQILSGEENLTGIHVMTMHKAKGKEFDAVIVFRDEHSSPLVWPGDPKPYDKSRRVLRVAITRARFHTLLLTQANPKCPILSEFKF